MGCMPLYRGGLKEGEAGQVIGGLVQRWLLVSWETPSNVRHQHKEVFATSTTDAPTRYVMFQTVLNE